MKTEVETSDKQVNGTFPYHRQPLPERVGLFLQGREREQLGQWQHWAAFAMRGRLAELETRATERHKVHSAEHKDYARTPALTWKNSQRNAEVHYSAPG